MLWVVSNVPFFIQYALHRCFSEIACISSHSVKKINVEAKEIWWQFVMSKRAIKPPPGLDSQTGVCSAMFLSPSKQLEGPMAVGFLWEVVDRRLNSLFCFFSYFSHCRLLCVLADWVQSIYLCLQGFLCSSSRCGSDPEFTLRTQSVYTVLTSTSPFRHQRACTQTKTFTQNRLSERKCPACVEC